MNNPQGIEISDELKRRLEQLALSEEDYLYIVSELGREPNDLELEIFGTMLAEHCSYRWSKALLQMLPSG